MPYGLHPYTNKKCAMRDGMGRRSLQYTHKGLHIKRKPGGNSAKRREASGRRHVERIRHDFRDRTLFVHKFQAMMGIEGCRKNSTSYRRNATSSGITPMSRVRRKLLTSGRKRCIISLVGLLEKIDQGGGYEKKPTLLPE